MSKETELIEGEYIPKEIVRAFNATALDVISRGFTRFGAFAIINKIRWEQAISRDGREFKCTNNWAPLLSRNFAKEYPEYKDLFVFKKRKAKLDTFTAA